jgi:hypothetical protein
MHHQVVLPERLLAVVDAENLFFIFDLSADIS